MFAPFRPVPGVRFFVFSLALLCLLLLQQGGAREARAQVQPQVDVGFIVGVFQGEFADNLDNDVGFGVDVFAGARVGASPVVLGVEGAFLIYGRESFREPFRPSGPGSRVDVEVETTNNIVMGHLVLRIQPATGIVRPYADGLFGVKYLFTESSIEDISGVDDRVFSSQNFDDAALSYGAGAGLDIQVYRREQPQAGRRKLGSVRLHLGARYLFGQEAEYLQEGSIQEEGDDLVFDVKRSRTDVLVPQIGVTFGF